MKDFDTQSFHFDDNAVNILKVFIYLQDINHISQGPFCYVKKSHQNIEKYWNEKVDLAVPGRAPRWDNNKIEQTFGKENIVPIFANKGDAIIANTVAFHKGIKPTIKDRSLMIINYNIHQDYVNNKPDALPNIDNKEFDAVKKTLKSGKHTLVEKPLAVTTKKCLELINIANSCNVSFGVMLNQRTNPIYKTLKQISIMKL